jgi:hypothetical protein
MSLELLLATDDRICPLGSSTPITFPAYLPYLNTQFRDSGGLLIGPNAFGAQCPLFPPACQQARARYPCRMRWIDGRQVGRNDPCPCDSGERVKDCCIFFIESLVHRMADPDPDLGVYVTSADLWPRRTVATEDARALARQFDPLDLTQTLAKISFVLHKGYSSRESAKELEILERFLPPVWLKKVRLWIDAGLRVKVVHRLAIPAAIQMVMAESGVSFERHPVQGHEHLVGQFLLALNSVLERDYEAQKAQRPNAVDQRALVSALLYRLAFYSEAEAFGPSLARQWAIVTKGLPEVSDKRPGEHFDFLGQFEEAFGFSAVGMMALTVGILGHYEEILARPLTNPAEFLVGEGFFTGLKSPEVQSSLAAIFAYLGRSWDEHVERIRQIVSRQPENLLQFFSFYERPLLRLPSGANFPLDMLYLNTAATEGGYWALFQRFLEEGRAGDAGRLRACFGRAFEWYVTELLRDAFPATEPQSRWFDWDGQISAPAGVPNPDAVLLEGDTLFVIEVTASGVSPAVAVSCDPGRLEESVRSIWFGRGPDRESAKLMQLARSVEALESGSLSLPGLERAGIRRILPVLVTLRSTPRNRLLRIWSADLMRSEGLTERFITDVTFLDPGEVEELAFLKRKGTPWSELWDRYRASPQAADSIHNFIYYAGLFPGVHPKLQTWVTESFNDFTDLLFGVRPYREEELAPDS